MKSLSAGKPIAISYEPSVFRQEIENMSQIKSGHDSTIIGRRWSIASQRCEVLIRNSWGSNACEKYDPQFYCKDGNPWVPIERMERAIFATTLID